MTGISALLNQDTSKAFPSLSTGIYGYPIETATRIALDETRLFLDTPDGDKVVDPTSLIVPKVLTYSFSSTVSFLSSGATETKMSTSLWMIPSLPAYLAHRL